MRKVNKDKNKPRLTAQALATWVQAQWLKIVLAIYFAAMWSWALQTDSLDLAGNKTQGLIIAAIVVTINVAISVAIMVWFIRLVGAVFAKHSKPSALLLGFTLFALADFLVAWVPAALWIGPEGRLDSVLPLGSPTLLIINTPLGFASRLIGFYGLAGAAWLLAYTLLQKKYRLYGAWVTVALVGLSAVGFVAWQNPNGNTLTATIISEELDNRVGQVDSTQTNLAVFPEYGLDKINDESIESRLSMDPGLEQPKTYFLGSEQTMPTNNQTGHFNTLIYGDTHNGIDKKQDKYRLIPGGEDLPYILRLGLRATNQVDTLHYFSFAKGVIKGSSQLEPLAIPEHQAVVGAAVCSSIISPEDYRHFASSGANILTNSASLTIFKGSRVFSWQQKSLAKFMAVANSRYFLQSANAARAYALDNNGQTTAEISGINTVNVTATTNNTKTFYTRAGELIVIAGLATLLVTTLAPRIKSRINKNARK